VNDFPRLRKFQNWHHPKNHEYDGEINETWDTYFSGTALAIAVTVTGFMFFGDGLRDLWDP